MTGILDGRILPTAPVTVAGRETIGGREVFVVRFTAQGSEWAVRFTPLFGPVATVAVCGPAGCTPGAGVAFVT